MKLNNPEILVLGIEGSANKIAVGIVGYDGTIYANIRKTHVTEAGKGFIPRETQTHHAFHVVELIQRALIEAFLAILPQSSTITAENMSPKQKREVNMAIVPRIACLCYTKGPGMAGCLGVGATVVRVLAQLWGRNALVLRKHHEAALFCGWKTPAVCLNESGSMRCQGFRHPHAFSSVVISQRHLVLPIIGVNHCVAHIEMGRLACGIQPPRGVHTATIEESHVSESSHSVVVLYVSGGNTQVITYNAHQYQIIGETIDIAVGNCIDRLARLLGVSNDPCAGANIEKLAYVARKRWENSQSENLEKNAANAQSNFIPLPYIVKGMDLSFSGLLSYCGEVLKHEHYDGNVDKTHPTSELIVHSIIKQPDSKPKARLDIHERFDIYDLCWSVEEHIFSSLVEVTERALCLSGAKHVLIVGGVGCNLRLQKMMKSMTEQRNARVGDSFISGKSASDDVHAANNYASHDMDERYCIDNGCMIAYTGALEHMAFVQNQTAHPEKQEDSESCMSDFLEKVNVCQRYRTDDVCVTWYAE